METPVLNGITGRLDRLEREARRWRCVAVVLGGLLGIVGLAGATTATPNGEELRARRFVVVDEDGRTRAALGLGRSGEPELALYDRVERGRVRVTLLFVNGDSLPSIGLHDKAGELRAHLFLGLDSDPALLLGVGSDQWRVRLSGGSSSGGTLGLFDGTGMHRVALGQIGLSMRDGSSILRPTSSLVLFDQDGKVLFNAP